MDSHASQGETTIMKTVKAATLIGLTLGVPLGTWGAAAGPLKHHRVAARHSSPTVSHAKARPILPRGVGHASTIDSFEVRQPQLHVTPAFIPGKGMLGTPCNLPTSACPNEMRDGG